MIQGHTIGVVIPCHNEERGLAAILPRCPTQVDEIVVVNNNSTDRTEEVARAHGTSVVFESVPGYGRAYQTGFAAARSDILVTLDGDGQYPIEEVPRLVGVFLERNLDFLSGCRFPLAGKAMTLQRRVGNFLLTTVIRFLFKANVRDTQSGMWIFRRDLLQVIRPTHHGMAFSEELKLRVILSGFRFGEEHIPYHQREGVSTLRPLRDGWENLRYLLQLRAETRAARTRHDTRKTPVRASARARAHSTR